MRHRRQCATPPTVKRQHISYYALTSYSVWFFSFCLKCRMCLGLRLGQPSMGLCAAQGGNRRNSHRPCCASMQHASIQHASMQHAVQHMVQQEMQQAMQPVMQRTAVRDAAHDAARDAAEDAACNATAQPAIRGWVQPSTSAILVIRSNRRRVRMTSQSYISHYNIRVLGTYHM